MSAKAVYDLLLTRKRACAGPCERIIYLKSGRETAVASSAAAARLGTACGACHFHFVLFYIAVYSSSPTNSNYRVIYANVLLCVYM